MKKILILITTMFLVIFYTSIAWGGAVGVGARAIGMGGAYTAVADDAYAPYWNPAGVTQKHFSTSFGVGYLGDFEKLQNVQDAISNDEMPSREDMNQNYQLSGFLGFTGKYFALSGFGDLQLNTVMDDSQGVAAGTNMTFEGYGVVTAAFTIGENIAVGINFKSVTAGYGEAVLPTFPDISSSASPADAIAAVNDYNTNTPASVSYNTGTGTACDIGTLIKLSKKVTLGFIARNAFTEINSEEGDKTNYILTPNTSDPNPDNWTLELVENPSTSNSRSIEIPKSYVLGLAFRPFKSTTIALDAETITNSSNDQTRFHFGIEQTALWNSIAIRLGCFTDKDEPLTYTAGLGFRLLWVIDTNVAVVQNDDDTAGIFTGEIRF